MAGICPYAVGRYSLTASFVLTSCHRSQYNPRMNDTANGPSQLNLRRATLEDASNIAEFNIAMARETEDLELKPGEINAGVNAMIDHPERGFYLVIEHIENNRPRVIASLMVTTEWSDWRNANFWWIQSVYVLPEWRRKGLYRQLYEEVKRLAGGEGNVCGFRLYVEKDNTTARNTYSTLGMQQSHYLMYEEEAITPKP